eukprot:Sro326_g118120.2  (828) ;mRNA; r:37763-40388
MARFLFDNYPSEEDRPPTMRPVMNPPPALEWANSNSSSISSVSVRTMISTALSQQPAPQYPLEEIMPSLPGHRRDLHQYHHSLSDLDDLVVVGRALASNDDSAPAILGSSHEEEYLLDRNNNSCYQRQPSLMHQPSGDASSLDEVASKCSAYYHGVVNNEASGSYSSSNRNTSSYRVDKKTKFEEEKLPEDEIYAYHHHDCHSSYNNNTSVLEHNKEHHHSYDKLHSPSTTGLSLYGALKQQGEFQPRRKSDGVAPHVSSSFHHQSNQARDGRRRKSDSTAIMTTTKKYNSPRKRATTVPVLAKCRKNKSDLLSENDDSDNFMTPSSLLGVSRQRGTAEHPSLSKHDDSQRLPPCRPEGKKTMSLSMTNHDRDYEKMKLRCIPQPRRSRRVAPQLTTIPSMSGCSGHSSAGTIGGDKKLNKGQHRQQQGDTTSTDDTTMTLTEDDDDDGSLDSIQQKFMNDISLTNDDSPGRRSSSDENQAFMRSLQDFEEFEKHYTSSSEEFLCNFLKKGRSSSSLSSQEEEEPRIDFELLDNGSPAEACPAKQQAILDDIQARRLHASMPAFSTSSFDHCLLPRGSTHSLREQQQDMLVEPAVVSRPDRRRRNAILDIEHHDRDATGASHDYPVQDYHPSMYDSNRESHHSEGCALQDYVTLVEHDDHHERRPSWSSPSHKLVREASMGRVLAPEMTIMEMPPTSRNTNSTHGLSSVHDDRMTTLPESGETILIKGVRHVFRALIQEQPTRLITCPCCADILQVEASAELVYCPDCEGLSPLEGTRSSTAKDVANAIGTDDLEKARSFLAECMAAQAEYVHDAMQRAQQHRGDRW